MKKFIKFIILLSIMLLSMFIIYKSVTADSSTVYDIILFWGQSNMRGRAGKEDNELKPDTRYDYTNDSSTSAYAKLSGVRQNFLSNSPQINYVTLKPGNIYMLVIKIEI